MDDSGACETSQQEIPFKSVDTLGLIKVVADTILDMIVTTYHHEPLIFRRARRIFPETLLY